MSDGGNGPRCARLSPPAACPRWPALPCCCCTVPPLLLHRWPFSASLPTPSFHECNTTNPHNKEQRRKEGSRRCYCWGCCRQAWRRCAGRAGCQRYRRAAAVHLSSPFTRACGPCRQGRPCCPCRQRRRCCPCRPCRQRRHHRQRWPRRPLRPRCARTSLAAPLDRTALAAPLRTSRCCASSRTTSPPVVWQAGGRRAAGGSSGVSANAECTCWWSPMPQSPVPHIAKMPACSLLFTFL